VGDILVGSGQAVTFVRDTALSDVLSLEKIGRIGVKTSCEADLSFIPEREFQDISGTVASLRVDSVISLALRISREKSAKLIKSGLVEVNHSLCDSQKKTLVEGDKLSVRGYGKFIFKSVDGSTKKDRIHITVCKYI
jgi:RNA-binding protein YlmH